MLDLKGLVSVMSCNPARILGIDRGTLRAGAVADVTIIDPSKEWEVDAAKLESKSKNSPFIGWKMKGKALYTVVKGQVVYQA